MNIRGQFEIMASYCPEYDPTNRTCAQITALADRYCTAIDNNDDFGRECYSSALILKFWDQIKNMYDKTMTVGGFEYGDFISILYERINYACKYRAWQNIDEATGKPRTTAQACINQAIGTEIKNIFYAANLDKSKVNSTAYKLSLDAPLKADDDLSWEDLLPANGIQYDESVDIIQAFVDKKKLVEAIILDTIASGECEKVTKESVKTVDSEGNPYKYVKRHSEFWPYKCVQLLSRLPEDYLDYFSDKYSCVEAEMQAAIKAIRKAPKTKLYKYLDATLATARADLTAN